MQGDCHRYRLMCCCCYWWCCLLLCCNWWCCNAAASVGGAVVPLVVQWCHCWWCSAAIAVGAVVAAAWTGLTLMRVAAGCPRGLAGACGIDQCTRSVCLGHRHNLNAGEQSQLISEHRQHSAHSEHSEHSGRSQYVQAAQ